MTVPGTDGAEDTFQSIWRPVRRAVIFILDGGAGMTEVYFVDTTLRDGEQAPGVAFTAAEKVRIAQMLDALGVDQIEAGIPAMGSPEVEALEEIASLGLKAVVSTWSRVTIGDIKASLACGIKNVHLSAPVSDILIHYKLGKDRVWVLESMRRAVSYARERGCRVTVGAEDASRADLDFLISFACHARREGVERLRLADTLGLLDPFSTKALIERLVSYTGMDLEFHGHNDFGLATANTLAAFKAGARYLSTTITGIGERAGNCSFEEAVQALVSMEKLGLKYDPDLLSQLCAFVRGAAGRSGPAKESVHRAG